MKIKIPNYGEIDPRNYDYIILGDKIYLCNRDFKRFELSKKGDKIIIASKYHVELLKLDMSRENVTGGVMLKPKINKPF